jgi:DNA-directed RNA polymerase
MSLGLWILRENIYNTCFITARQILETTYDHKEADIYYLLFINIYKNTY